MRSFLSIWILFLLLSSPGLFGQVDTIQESSLQADSVQFDVLAYADLVRQNYPLEQSLVNGVKYMRPYRLQRGHPYLITDEFWRGSVDLNGLYFTDVLLRFNLYYQQLELAYTGGRGSNWITLPDEHTASFFLGPMEFRKLKFDDEKSNYYQVVETPSFLCYIYWEKSRKPGALDGVEFLDEQRSLLLKINGELRQFKNNRKFSRFFAKEHQKEIRRLLRDNSFNFHTANGLDLIENLNAVYTLIEEKNSI